MYLYASILHVHVAVCIGMKDPFPPLHPNFQAENKNVLNGWKFTGKHCLASELATAYPPIDVEKLLTDQYLWPFISKCSMQFGVFTQV